MNVNTGRPENRWRKSKVIGQLPLIKSGFSLAHKTSDNIFITCFFRTETYMICFISFYVVKNEISAGSNKRQSISQ